MALLDGHQAAWRQQLSDYDICRRLRHSPLGELGPVTWEAAALIERLQEENRNLLTVIKEMKEEKSARQRGAQELGTNSQVRR